MKQFIIKILILITSIAFIYTVASKINIGIFINGDDIYHVIKKSNKKVKLRTLLLGDSVANQMFSCKENDADTFYSLTNNQAITMAGHFILANNFIQANKSDLPDKIILLYHPMSLRNNLDNSVYSYHYFLKPFYKKENYRYFNSYLDEKVKQIPMYRASQIPFINNSNYSPKYSVLPCENKFSQISKSYIDSLITVCQDNNIEFHMYAPPISEVHREAVAEIFNNEDIESYSILTDYFNSILYVSDSLFSDKVHFRDEQAKEIGRQATKEYFK